MDWNSKMLSASCLRKGVYSKITTTNNNVHYEYSQSNYVRIQNVFTNITNCDVFIMMKKYQYKGEKRYEEN